MDIFDQEFPQLVHAYYRLGDVYIHSKSKVIDDVYAHVYADVIQMSTHMSMHMSIHLSILFSIHPTSLEAHQRRAVMRAARFDCK